MLKEAIRAAFSDESLYLEDFSFEGQSLCGDFLGGLELIRISFDGCRFENCDFKRTSFTNCKFNNCVFTGCSFSDAYFKGCEIHGCKGDECSFTNACFKQSRIEQGSFCYANFSHSAWYCCTVQGAVLRFSFFTESKLKSPRLIDVTLSGADFFKTPLKGVDLSSCRIDGITVSASHSELAGAMISADQAVDLIHILGVKLV